MSEYGIMLRMDKSFDRLLLSIEFHKFTTMDRLFVQKVLSTPVVKVWRAYVLKTSILPPATVRRAGLQVRSKAQGNKKRTKKRRNSFVLHRRLLFLLSCRRAGPCVSFDG